MCTSAHGLAHLDVQSEVVKCCVVHVQQAVRQFESFREYVLQHHDMLHPTLPLGVSSIDIWRKHLEAGVETLEMKSRTGVIYNIRATPIDQSQPVAAESAPEAQLAAQPSAQPAAAKSAQDDGNSDNSSSDDSSSDDERAYVVEKVLKRRQTAKDFLGETTEEFFIQWAGYDESENSWEPLQQLYYEGEHLLHVALDTLFAPRTATLILTL